MFYSKPWLDALIVLLVVVLFFGPKRLPQLGKSLGQGFKEFKDGITGAHKDDGEEQPALPQATATQQVGAEPAGQPMPTSASPERESAEVASSEQHH
jgi:sec-independent protein translocase protein TatA